MRKPASENYKSEAHSKFNSSAHEILTPRQDESRYANFHSKLLVSPVKLFVFAQAFRFSSGRGQCFSPGMQSLCVWHYQKIRRVLLDRSALKWWRVWLEKV